MSVYQQKKGGVWYYQFQFRGQAYNGSTGEKQRGRALTVEANVKSKLAEGAKLPGLRKTPILSDYAKQFLADVDEQAAAGHYTKNGRLHYHDGVRLLTGQIVWEMRLNEITAEHGAKLKFPGPASGNKALRVLRRMLSLVEERGLIHRVPKLKMYEDRERETIAEPWLEEMMLAYAKPPLYEAILFLVRSFVRPAEVMAMRWEDVNFSRNGFFVADSKTPNGKRWRPFTTEMRAAIEARRGLAKESPWVFPSDSECGHTLPSSLDKMFRTMRSKITAKVRESDPSWQWPKGLVLYSMKHTGLTAYSEASGNNQLKVATAAGHGDLRTTRRYVKHADDSAQVMDKVVSIRRRA